MSSYEELQQLVSDIAGEAQDGAFNLMACAGDIEKCVTMFSKLTSSTKLNSAKTVEASFYIAHKQLLIAAKALAEASRAGFEWSGESIPQKKLVLTRKR